MQPREVEIKGAINSRSAKIEKLRSQVDNVEDDVRNNSVYFCGHTVTDWHRAFSYQFQISHV